MKQILLIVGLVAVLALAACAPVEQTPVEDVPTQEEIAEDLPQDDTPTTPPFPPVNPGQDETTGTVLAGSQQEQCEAFGGNYVAEFNECEGIDESACLELGGTHNACASACRNDPDAEICTMQCVIVCDLP